MYRLISEPIPATHYVAARRSIKAIDPSRVASVDHESIDVTSHSDDFRQFRPLDVTLRDAKGRVLLCAPSEVAQIALNGGGEVFVLSENPVHCYPMTLEEYEAELEGEEDGGDWWY
jgi:hypothetical protein